MKRVKVSKLDGIALDWAVAKCEGLVVGSYGDSDFARSYCPSACWSQGGPIIEREFIAVFSVETQPFSGEWAAERYRHQQIRVLDDMGAEGYCFYESKELFRGPTSLIAAMRCYVASKLGEEVEVPEELL